MAQDVPSYVPLLNQIAAAEAIGERMLKCWAEKAKNPELAKVLNAVAIREGEHSKAFEKRLCELGYSVDWSDTLGGGPETDAYVAFLESDASDEEKLERAFGLVPEGADPFKGFFDDQSIDPTTGALLGRYIAEERDSGRMLRQCYEDLCGSRSSGESASLEDVCQAVTSLTGLVTELKGEIAALKAGA